MKYLAPTCVALLALTLLAACQKSSFQTASAPVPATIAPIGGSGSELEVEAAMAETGVPSVSIAVIDGGRIAWVRAWGEGVTTATPFQAGAMSQPVTAATALVLVERGTMTLDDDVGRWIEAWRVDIPGQPVNLRGLLSMTAGVNIPGFEGYPPNTPLPSLAQILGGSGAANSPAIAVAASPDTLFAISAGGYEIVEAALQGATGDDFAEISRAAVLVPAGMAASAFEQPPGDTLAAIAARGHDAAGRQLPGGWRVMPERAAAGLWATAGDLARFLIALDASFEGDGLLNPDMAQELVTRQNGGPWGLGFAIAGEGRSLALHRSGANPGYRGTLIFFPATGQGAVVMTGSDNGAPLAEAVLRRLGELHDWPWDGVLVD